MKVDFVEKKSSYSLGSDSFLSGAENYPLCKAMVDHDQQGIKTGGCGKVGNKVTGDLLEGVRSERLDWSEWGDSGVCVGLVLLACGIVFDIFLHKLYETRQPELGSNELMDFEITRVADSLMVMVSGQDGATEGVFWRNIDMAFVHENMVIIFPV